MTSLMSNGKNNGRITTKSFKYASSISSSSCLLLFLLIFFFLSSDKNACVSGQSLKSHTTNYYSGWDLSIFSLVSLTLAGTCK